MAWGNFFDNVGTALNLPEFGISEYFNGGKSTNNTGRIGLSSGTGTWGGSRDTANAWRDAMMTSGKMDVAGNIKAPQVNGGRRVGNDPAPNNTPNRNGNQWWSNGGGSSAPAIDRNAIAQFDQAANTIQGNLNRLNNQNQIAKQNIGTQFNQKWGELDTGKNNAQNNYNLQTTQNQQSNRTSKNLIADQQSNGLRGMLRTLGAFGAGGSTDALLASPAAADQASQQRAGANQTFAQNQRELDTNWNNFVNSDEQERKKLNDWKTNQERSVDANTETQRQDLLSKLADVSGRRAAAAGGSYAGGAESYLAQANALGGRIDDLGRMVATYSGNTPVYQQATLDSYQTGPGAAGKVEANLPSNNPALAQLLGLGKKEEDKVVF